MAYKLRGPWLIAILVLPTVLCVRDGDFWDITNLQFYEEGNRIADLLSANFNKNCHNRTQEDVIIEADVSAFDGCGEVFLCNQTVCLIFRFSAVVWSKQTPRDPTKYSNTYYINKHNFFLYVSAEILPQYGKTLLNWSEMKNTVRLLPYNIELNMNRLPGIDNYNYFLQAQRLKRLTSKISASLSQYCLGRQQYSIVLPGYGPLPDGCSNVTICDTTSCTTFSKTSFSYAEYRERNVSSLTEPTCVIKEKAFRLTQRRRRAPTTTPDQTFTTLLRFNLPGYKYCGPGTNIEMMDDEGGPINDLDAACRQHDVDYLTGMDAAQADRRLLESVYTSSPAYYPIFFAVFQAKSSFEDLVGREYTSYLYFYTDEFNPSLTMYFSQHSTVQNYQGDHDVHVAKSAESRWMQVVHDIWEGTCTNIPKDVRRASKIYPGSARFGGTRESGKTEAGTPVAGTSSSSSDANFPVVKGVKNTVIEDDPRTCRVFINEVLTTMRHVVQWSKQQFVEVVRRCGKYAKVLKLEMLEGYALVGVDIGEFRDNGVIVPAIVLQADLSTGRFRERLDVNGKPEWYFVLGHGVDNIGVSLNTVGLVQHLHTQDEDAVDAIPYEKVFPTALLLLHFKVKDRHLMKKLKLSSDVASMEGIAKQLSPELLEIIKPRVVDLFVYGQSCPISAHRILKSIYPKFPDDCNDGLFSSTNIIPFFEQDPKLSFSRCSTGNTPFQYYSFKEAPLTPGEVNKCEPDVKLDYPFQLKHKRLQSTAQKLVLNAWNSIKAAKLDSRILEGEPQVVVSRILGVSVASIKKANYRWRNNAIMTPGKTRRQVNYVQVLIDSFDRSWIRNEIVSMYKKNVAPTLTPLYNKFKSFKIEQIEQLEQQHYSEPTLFSKPSPFRCSITTFCKVLKLMGFKFGKLDNRAAIIQTPYIAGWRGKYLRALRDNSKLEKPRKVVYIDETWVDASMRIARGWVPAKCNRFKDMTPFTYSNWKVGRGPRLVVLAAVAEDGVIAPSVLAYKVSKAKSAADYHDNVNSETFTRWYKELLDILDATQEKYIIVMDNASYHTAKVMPKKSERKQVLYDWLKKQIGKPGLHITLPENIKNIRKFELEEKLDEVSSTPGMESEMYAIDQLTKEKGHVVLRLPPYNCDLNVIELCWKDSKHNCKKLNTDGNLDNIKKVIENELRNFDKDILKKHWAHVKRLEQKYWDEDGHMEELPEGSIIIQDYDDEEEDDMFQDESDNDDSSDDDGEDSSVSAANPSVLESATVAPGGNENAPLAQQEDINVDEVEIGGDMIFYEESELGQMRIRDQQELELAGFMEPPPKRARHVGRYCQDISRRLFPLEEN